MFRYAGDSAGGKVHRLHALQDALAALVSTNGADEEHIVPESACMCREVEWSSAEMFSLSDYVP